MKISLKATEFYMGKTCQLMDQEIRHYIAANNRSSIDGLPGLDEAQSYRAPEALLES